MPCLIFLQTATFSLLPLLRQDDLLDAYVYISLLYLVALRIVAETQLRAGESSVMTWLWCWDVLQLRRLCFSYERPEDENDSSSNTPLAEMMLRWRWLRGKITDKDPLRFWCGTIMVAGFYATFCLQATMVYLLAYVNPPAQLPHLWPLLISAVSAGYFCVFFVYFTAKLWLLTDDDLDVDAVPKQSTKLRKKVE